MPNRLENSREDHADVVTFRTGAPEEAPERLRFAARILRLTETVESVLTIDLHNLARQIEALADQLDVSPPSEVLPRGDPAGAPRPRHRGCRDRAAEFFVAT